MKAIIVAAGRGSRMGHLTKDKPKCFLEFQGKKLIDWQIESLLHNHITNISLVRGYKEEAFNDLPYSINYYTNPDWETTNMVYSLMCASEQFEPGEDILVSYGDIIYQPDIIQTILACKGNIVISVDRNWQKLWKLRSSNPLEDAESLVLSDDHHVLNIGQKVSKIDEIEAQYMGLILLRGNSAKEIQNFYRTASDGMDWLAGRPLKQAYMTDLLTGLISEEIQVKAAIVHGGWLEFDTVDDLNTYNTQLQATSELFFRKGCTP